MAELTPRRLIISQSQVDKLIAEAEKQTPNEACGLIAGENGMAKIIFPLTNISENPFTFLMEPGEQISTLFRIEELGLELAAIFHSHPHSPPIPSPTDIMESHYPDIPYIIIGKEDGEWALKVFLINNQIYDELDLIIISP